MIKRCTVCNHPDLPAIDRALRNGASQRHLAHQFGLSIAAVSRHVKHLPDREQHSRQVEDQAAVELDDIKERVLSMAEAAHKANNLALALQAYREAVHVLTAIAKLTRPREEQAPFQLFMNPEWRQMRTTIMKALEPYPEVREAVVEALSHAEE